MTARRTTFRPLTLILAVLAMAASCIFDAQTAQAKCCQVNIENQTNCTIEAYLLTTTGNRRLIQINPGLNEYLINCGDDYEVVFRDACGPADNPYRRFPTDGCFDIRLKPSCCINVCSHPFVRCGILITPGLCKYCP